MLFGIFAHPDDEAFGPAATLCKLASQDIEVHLICATEGQAGMNPDHVPDLGETRCAEWRKAGKVIGATTMHNLHYEDGKLCNDLYHEIAHKITAIITKEAAKHRAVEISLMTFDPNGLTGHLDHIAMSNITSYVFYTLKSTPPAHVRMGKLLYYCFSETQCPRLSTSYVFMDKGRPKSYLTHTENVRDFVQQKFEAAFCHKSQRHDAAALMSREPELQEHDYFHVRE